MAEGRLGRERIPSRARLILEEHRLSTAAFIRYFSSLNPDYAVLDVACGDGYHLEILRNLGFKRIYGIDTDEEMLELAEEKGLNVRYGSVYELEIKGVFDVILMCDLIDKLDDPELALRRVHDALKEDGILYLTAHVGESLAAKLRRRKGAPGSISTERVLDLLQRAGFEVEHKMKTANKLPFGKVQSITFGGRFGNWLIIVARKVGRGVEDEDVEDVRQDVEGDTG
ncbi:hypothetical protein DRP77_09160 [Candidatus Poribacteria bacterium]|nr:MAG: hypothetical protein DRP77_09160 [Candidatus Poribacteria bacterium]